MKAICLVAALVSSMVISADSAKTDFPVELLGDLNGMSLPRTKSASTGSLIKGASDLVIATKTQAKAKKRCLHAVGELLEIVDKSDFTQLCRDYGYEVFSGEKTSRKIDITGFYNEAGSPTINAAVSRLCNISLGPIGNARSDLDSVLGLDWYNNSFQLAIEVAGIKLVDEDIYIDRGDVVLIKAFLKAAEGALYFLRGVDVTMDYEEVMSAAVDVYSDFVDAELDLISAFDLSPFSRLSISDKSDIQKARAAFAEAVSFAKTGDALVKARNDGLNHLMQYERGGLSDVIQFMLRHEQSLLAALDQFITPLQMANAAIASGVFELTYTGEPLSPSIGSVTVGGTSVPYNLGGTTSATEIGTYELTLVGYGRSTGTKTVVWKIVEPPPSSVVFDLAGHGTRTGGGELEQLVAWKQAAVAPEVVPETGYRFLGWDKEFDDVVGALTVTAQWEQIRYVVDLDGKILDDCVYGQEMTASTFASVTNGLTNIVCTGWVGTGDVPATGDGAEVTFTVTQPSTLRWLYQTNYWINVFGTDGGRVVLTDASGAEVPSQGWFECETNFVALAVPDRGFRLVRWGEVVSDGEGGWTRIRTLSTQTSQWLRVDAPWNVRAEFAETPPKPDGGPYEETVDGISWTYTVENGEASVGRGSSGGAAVPSSTAGAITIPSILGKRSVTSIGASAFDRCYWLTSVTIPSSVTSIGEDAFFYCSRLTSVTIPSSVTSIGKSAFSWCSGLTSVTIPEGVTRIGNSTFFHCIGLTSVTIPSSVTSIGDGAFGQCSGLESMIIPEGVTIIENCAFLDCSGLTSVTIPEGVLSIGDYAFDGCGGLTSVTIPSSVTSIGDWAFHCCSNLTIVTTYEGLDSIGEGAFCGCGGLKSITIPSGVTGIGNKAFYGCDGLTSVTIPSSVTRIGDGVFEFCDGLTSVEITAGVVSIGDETFAYCGRLTSVTIPSSVTTIGDKAFYDCEMLTSMTIPSSVVSIGDRAFADCDGLTSVTIPSSVTRFGAYAFCGCGGLKSVSISDGMTSVGYCAFRSCSGLTSVTIPSSVTSIGYGAFEYCDALTTVYVDVGDTARVKFLYSWGSGVTFVEGHAPYTVEMRLPSETKPFDVHIWEQGKVYQLPDCTATPPVGKCFAGWQCSNGKRYDDGMLVFNLAQPGETVTMTAIWE